MAEHGEPLSGREIEVLQEVATGATNRETAYALNISPNTVKVHLRNIFTKLGAESRTEATMIAVKQGLVSIPTPDTETAPDTGQETGPAAEPLPPLPWFRRAALLLVALLVVAGTIVSWPQQATSRSSADNLLPSRGNVDEESTPLVGDAEHWEERAQMPTRRAGLAVAAWGRRLYAIGGEEPDGVSAVVEVYDITNDSWSRAADKPTPVAYISAGVADGTLYVPGGCTESGTAIAALEVYDPASDQWTEGAPLPSPRCAYALTIYQGKIYLFGGTDGEKSLKSTLVYDPQSDTWEERAPLPDARTIAGAAVLQNRIYVVGGYHAGQELTTCNVYDPENDRWDACAPLSIGRSGLGLVPLGGWLYTIGGGEYLGFNERYDPQTDLWTTTDTPLTGSWQNPGVVLLNTVIYAIGGWSNDYLGLNLAFEPLPIQLFLPITESQN